MGHGRKASGGSGSPSRSPRMAGQTLEYDGFAEGIPTSPSLPNISRLLHSKITR